MDFDFRKEKQLEVVPEPFITVPEVCNPILKVVVVGITTTEELDSHGIDSTFKRSRV
jgi:hypothetical protein